MMYKKTSILILIMMLSALISGGCCCSCFRNQNPEIDGLHLEEAINAKRPRLVKKLLEMGANPNLVNTETPLEKNFKCNKLDGQRKEIFDLLIEYGADVNFKNPSNHYRTVLHCAYRLDLDTMELLIENGANVNAKGENQETPVIQMLEDSDPYLYLYDEVDSKKISSKIELLIENGADVNARKKDKFGKSLLDWIILSNLFKVNGLPELLVEKGADVNAKDADGNTTLVKFVKELIMDTDRYRQVFKYSDIDSRIAFLIENGADVNVKDNSGMCAMDYAERDAEITEILKKHGGK